MICWHEFLNREFIEKRTLRHLPWSHHRCTSTLKTSESAPAQPINGLFQHYLRAADLGAYRSESLQPVSS